MSEDSNNNNCQESCSDDSMKSHFDVIVVGTGMTESILACILAKHGYSILHLDSNDYYGKSWASHSLNSLFEICEADDKTSDFLNKSPRGYKVIDFLNPFNSLDSEVGSSLKEDTGILPERSSATETFYTGANQVNPVDKELLQQKIERNQKLIDLSKISRRFNIDFPSTGLLFSSGDFVNFLIKSKTSNYLEFQSLDGLYYLQSTRGSNATTMQTELFSVPCSKGDVFKSNLLNVFEKRSLMKFLQAVADWGRLESGIEVQTLNEVDLAQGRSLHRPQNKELSADEFDFADSYDKSFIELLDQFKLSTKLKEIVCHSLCLYSYPLSSASTAQITSKKGLQDLYRHLSSIGKFGDSAFLTPLYGSGELSQAFCRMCAVWGGTYILRRSVARVEEISRQEAPVHEVDGQPTTDGEIKSEKRFSVVDTEGTTFTCSKLIMTANEMPIHATSPTISSSTSSQCNGLNQRFILTHVAIFDSSSISDQTKAKSLIIIPPEAISESQINSIFVIQLDSSISVVPKGYHYLSISIEVELLSQDDQDGRHYCKTLVAAALKSLSRSCNDRLCYATTLKPLTSEDTLASSSFSQDCFAITHERTLSMSPDLYLEEAQAIFAAMFPGVEFVKDVPDESTTESEYLGGTDAETESDFRQLESTLQAIQNAQPDQKETKSHEDVVQ